MQTRFSRHRLAYLVCFALFASTIGHAQQRWSAGPRLGVNVSKFAGTDLGGTSFDPKFYPGLAAGAFLMYSSESRFGASLDLLYSQRGASFNNLAGTGATVKERINYLEIPIALRYFLNEEGRFRPNIYAGPSVAFLLNANTKATGSTGSTVTTDITNSFKKTELGVLGGFQLNFKSGSRQRFLIDARYTYGLTPVFVETNNTVGNMNNARNSTITLTLGYGFGLGRDYGYGRRR
jgi:outer membrane protein W